MTGMQQPLRMRNRMCLQPPPRQVAAAGPPGGRSCPRPPAPGERGPEQAVVDVEGCGLHRSDRECFENPSPRTCAHRRAVGRRQGQGGAEGAVPSRADRRAGSASRSPHRAGTVGSASTVSGGAPMLVETTGQAIAWASAAARPNASGSVEATMVTADCRVGRRHVGTVADDADRAGQSGALDLLAQGRSVVVATLGVAGQHEHDVAEVAHASGGGDHVGLALPACEAGCVQG